MLSKAQKEYKQIARRSLAGSFKTFNAAVVDFMDSHAVPAEKRTPEIFVRAAKAVRFKCRRCAGTGKFVTGTLNGQPTGPGGICYRCNGRGSQNDADRRRNFGYDNHAAGKAMAADLNPAPKSSAPKCHCGEPATENFNGTMMCEECWADNCAAEHEAYMEG